jgi:dipeptidase E
VGGGNGFRLLKELYRHEGLVEARARAHLSNMRFVERLHVCSPSRCASRAQTIRERVLSGQLAFIGSSAGTNAAGQSLHVSICMPICAPPTFNALGVVPFLVSPHYHDAENKAKLAANGMYVGMEETREQRIAQYFEERDAGGHPLPVVGLREGGLLRVIGNTATLHGLRGARVFAPLEGAPTDFGVGDDISAAVGLTRK